MGSCWSLRGLVECAAQSRVGRPLHKTQTIKGRVYDLWYEYGSFDRVAKLTLKDECRIDKRDERLAPVKAWVDEQYNNGRDTVIGDDEQVAVIKEKSAGLWEALSWEKTE